MSKPNFQYYIYYNGELVHRLKRGVIPNKSQIEDILIYTVGIYCCEVGAVLDIIIPEWDELLNGTLVDAYYATIQLVKVEI
jgi:hypothetical protein